MAPFFQERRDQIDEATEAAKTAGRLTGMLILTLRGIDPRTSASQRQAAKGICKLLCGMTVATVISRDAGGRVAPFLGQARRLIAEGASAKKRATLCGVKGESIHEALTVLTDSIYFEVLDLIATEEQKEKCQFEITEEAVLSKLEPLRSYGRQSRWEGLGLTDGPIHVATWPADLQEERDKSVELLREICANLVVVVDEDFGQPEHPRSVPTILDPQWKMICQKPPPVAEVLARLTELRNELEHPPSYNPSLQHILVQWEDGAIDPTIVRGKHALTDEPIDNLFVDMADEVIRPEYCLISWQDFGGQRYAPGKACRHWVGVKDSLSSDYPFWEWFAARAEALGNLLRELPDPSQCFSPRILHVINPVERWVLALHQILRSEQVRRWVLRASKRSPHRLLRNSMLCEDQELVFSDVEMAKFEDVRSATINAINNVLELRCQNSRKVSDKVLNDLRKAIASTPDGRNKPPDSIIKLVRIRSQDARAGLRELQRQGVYEGFAR